MGEHSEPTKEALRPHPNWRIFPMASLEEKQIAKEILVAYVESTKNNIFNTVLVAETQFESIWDRIIKKVSDQDSAPSSPAN